MSNTDYVRLKREFLFDVRSGKLTDAFAIADATVKFLRKVIAHGKWTTIEQLITLLRTEGGSLMKSLPTHFVVGNMVKRILKLVREEHVRLLRGGGGDDESTLPDPHDSLYKLWKGNIGEKPAGIGHRELRSSTIENINEFLSELENCSENVAAQAPDHIADGDSVMTIGYSPALEAFLKVASKKCRFKLFIVQSAPSVLGKRLESAMKSSMNVDVSLIDDTKIFACMSHVNKVVIEADAVFANGELRACCGSYTVCVAAKHFSVPVIVLAAFYKLTPVFLSHDDHERYNIFASPLDLVPFKEADIVSNVEIYNPQFDYVAPDLLTLLITNVSGNAPSYIYRLLNELCHPEDIDL